MARGRNSKSEKGESAAGSLEVGMLCKSAFNDSELESYLRQGEILNYRASFPEGKRQILYFDTEQSRYHCHNVVERIYRLAGLSLNKEDKRIKFYGLREFTPTLRIALIDYALRTFDGVGLVIIDGLRDLIYDINNANRRNDDADGMDEQV